MQSRKSTQRNLTPVNHVKKYGVYGYATQVYKKTNSFSAPPLFVPSSPSVRTRARRKKKTNNRLPAPTALRIEPPGPAQVAAAAAAAAAGATAATGFFAVRSGRKAATADAAGGSLFARVGARGVLAARLLSDVAAAAVASMMVSPFISIVDRAIIQSASGSMGMQASVAQGLRVLATKPALFLARPDFICTFCLYGATCKSGCFFFRLFDFCIGCCLVCRDKSENLSSFPRLRLLYIQAKGMNDLGSQGD